MKDVSTFYERKEWREVRYRVLRRFGYKCFACNRTRNDGVRLHVDHIKPKSIFPELALDENNLQVLCEDCNMGKSNKFSDDLRDKFVESQLNSDKLWEKTCKVALKIDSWLSQGFVKNSEVKILNPILENINQTKGAARDAFCRELLSFGETVEKRIADTLISEGKALFGGDLGPVEILDA